MRGVGHEAAQALLVGLPLAGTLLDLAEHLIECAAELAELGALIALRHAAGEVAAGDCGRGVDHLVDRPELTVDDPPARSRGDQQTGQADRDQPDEQAADGGIDLGERFGNYDHVPRDAAGLDQDAVLNRAVLGRERDELADERLEVGAAESGQLRRGIGIIGVAGGLALAD